MGHCIVSQSDHLKASWTITPELEFNQTINFGWEAMYHNNFSFRELLRKSYDKIFQKKNIKYQILWIFLPTYEQKLIFCKK